MLPTTPPLPCTPGMLHGGSSEEKEMVQYRSFKVPPKGSAAAPPG